MKIEVNNLSKSYKKLNVLNQISFEAQDGQCIGILGGNGSGKSTLLSTLAGVQKCNSGEFLADGENLFLNRKKLADLVGYVPQGTTLIEELTAYDNLLLWYSKKQIKAELNGGILELLGINDFLKTPVCNMSGGMKKRLSIGCSMAKHPPIIILDEPTTALDLVCKQQILAYLKQHKSKGGIIIIATHDIMELEICDSCYIIKDSTAHPFSFNGDIEDLVKRL